MSSPAPDDTAETSGNRGGTRCRWQESSRDLRAGSRGEAGAPSASPAAAPLLWARRVPPPHLIPPPPHSSRPAAAVPRGGGLLARASLTW